MANKHYMCKNAPCKVPNISKRAVNMSKLRINKHTHE